MTPTGRRLHTPSRRWAAWAALSVTLIALTATIFSWQLRAFTVESPSMGAIAPVGSLVISSAKATPEVGSVITFRPSASSDHTYTHRVHAMTAHGITTQGDLNGTPDPWTVQPAEIVGTAVAILPGMGYGLRIACFTAIAGLITFAATTAIRNTAVRRSIRIDITSLALAASIALVKPLSGFVVLAASNHGKTVANVVSTSVLPTVIRPHGGGVALPLTYGHTGDVVANTDHGRFTVYSALDLPWWGWVLLLSACLVPTVVAILNTRRRASAPASAATAPALESAFA